MKFQVIQGGLATVPGQAATHRAEVFNQAHQPGQEEADRLSAAILELHLPDAGINVEQALDEVYSHLHDEDIESIERGSFLLAAMESLGLRFQLGNPELELVREGLLALVWPKRLLAAQPDIAHLHPLAHPFLMLG